LHTALNYSKIFTMMANLTLIVAEGEGQKIEFKEGLNRLDREIVAFANASGGSIFLGIADSGEIQGVDVSNEMVSRVQDIARNCDPSIEVSTRRRGKRVLEVQVPEGDHKPHQCKDGFFLRTGPNSQKLKRGEIIRIATSSGAYHFDESINNRFKYPEDLSGDALQRFLELSGIVHQADPDTILLSLDVAESRHSEIRLRQAGVLFFAREPQLFLKESQITCVRYQGTDRFQVADRCEIEGTAIPMIENALDFVKKSVSVAYQVTGEAQRLEIFTYPLSAVREAIINAVMHRDYLYDCSHIYVHIFSDRLEVESPGGLPPGLTMKDLGQRSVRRNRAIADLLYRAKFVERIGSGLQRMERALTENGNPPMEISATNFFVVRFLPRVEKMNSQSLTKRQYTLYQYVRECGGMSKRDAASFLAVSGDTALREIKVLLKEGLLTQTGVGRGIKYVPTNSSLNGRK
jgi:ATP-dependent DNA helicase RecG